jgi:hypothetical protein
LIVAGVLKVCQVFDGGNRGVLAEDADKKGLFSGIAWPGSRSVRANRINKAVEAPKNLIDVAKDGFWRCGYSFVSDDENPSRGIGVNIRKWGGLDRGPFDAYERLRNGE